MADLTFKTALRSLGASQKPSAGVSLYSRFVNRPLGRVLAAAAASARFSPNLVTALSALTTLAALAIVALVKVGVIAGLSVALLLVLAFALDSADGQVARLTGTGSLAGEWLDHVVDSGKMVAVHASVLIAAARQELLDAGWLLLPLAYMFVAVVLFSALTIFELLKRTRETGPSTSRPPSLFRSIALLPADYGVLCIAFAFWGAPAVFFPLYGFLFGCTTLITIALLTKWFRALRAV